MTQLDLSQNLLSGEIPAELGSLYNLSRLHIAPNPLTGCIPAGLRDVRTNDLSELGLPFCAPSP